MLNIPMLSLKNLLPPFPCSDCPTSTKIEQRYVNLSSEALIITLLLSIACLYIILRLSSRIVEVHYMNRPVTIPVEACKTPYNTTFCHFCRNICVPFLLNRKLSPFCQIIPMKGDVFVFLLTIWHQAATLMPLHKFDLSRPFYHVTVIDELYLY